MSEWKPAESVDAVRDEVRGALFNVGLMQLNEFVCLTERDWDMVRQKMCFLAEVGMRSGLLTPEECNDWFDGIWGKKPLGIVSNKWMSDDPEVVADAKEMLAEATA